MGIINTNISVLSIQCLTEMVKMNKKTTGKNKNNIDLLIFVNNFSF